ncbi:hypothetical protein [Escherichia coli]|uniref:hypothetical protein n=1 Tax=Escherichia coli TaxID=562 RepID=UPI00092974F4|nr:hypothetical protein [Escherichia coli]OJP92364.1 hypothetical protein BK352_24210 [Escherichia coli]
MNTKVLFVKKALKSIACATLSLLPALSRAVTELRSLSAARLKAGKRKELRKQLISKLFSQKEL